LFIFLLVQKNEPKKGHFFEGVSNLLSQNWNHAPPPKFSPRLQKFLTPGKHYTDKKDPSEE
jgi:hypothetical protein